MTPKILLIGDKCTDVFIYGDCYRLNPEAPTPVLSETSRFKFQGMAANVLNNLIALGLSVDFISHTEDIVKTRYIDEKSNYILLRIDNDNKVESIKGLDKIDFENYDLTIISDYDKGFLREEDLKIIFEKSKVSFIDTKKPIESWMAGATFIKINEAEYNNPRNDTHTMFKELAEKLIVTMGSYGTMYDSRIYKPPYEVLVRDVVGAGDTFLAAVAGYYFIHKDINGAIEFANLCAGQVVNKKGIAFPEEKLI